MNSAMNQFSVDASKYAPVTSNPYDSGSGLWNGVIDLFTAGYTSSQRDKINRANEAYNTNMANALEEARLQSARQYEEYMDSTKYQRAVADLEKAGINPYLLFSHGGIDTSSNASASAVAANSPKASNYKANSSNSLISSALKLMAILALKG